MATYIEFINEAVCSKALPWIVKGRASLVDPMGWLIAIQRRFRIFTRVWSHSNERMSFCRGCGFHDGGKGERQECVQSVRTSENLG